MYATRHSRYKRCFQRRGHSSSPASLNLTMANHFSEIGIAQQKHYNTIPFPSVVSPIPSAAPSLLAAAVAADKSYLDSLLHKTGAILFRGFPLTTASDFNDAVGAFDFEELPYVGGAAPRTNIVGRVFTANESPPDQKIPFHHEMAQVLFRNYTVVGGQEL